MQEYIKKINIGNVEVKNNVFLGPMAGVTDIAFRTICREFGPGLTFTEMASTKAMEFDSKKTKDLLKIPDNERPSVVQIFGSNKDVIGNTIKKLNEEESIDIIDINMGCPAPKLVKNGDGAGLLLNIKNVEEILNEAIDKSEKIIEEKNPTLENKKEVAKMVGVGAVIFNDLSNNRIKDEIFDWNQLLNFNGETGPYMQYTYVRTQSILRNAGIINIDESKINFEKLLDAEAIDVIKRLSEYTDIVISATNKNEPSIISRYLIDLAHSFSRFYNEHQIICDDEETKMARLALTKCVGATIKSGLGLLGIQTPEKM